MQNSLLYLLAKGKKGQITVEFTALPLGKEKAVQKIQQKWPYSIIRAFCVKHSDWTALFLMLMHHPTRSSYKCFNNSDDTIQTNIN